jgi:hypothetical protein
MTNLAEAYREPPESLMECWNCASRIIEKNFADKDKSILKVTGSGPKDISDADTNTEIEKQWSLEILEGRLISPSDSFNKNDEQDILMDWRVISEAEIIKRIADGVCKL